MFKNLLLKTKRNHQPFVEHLPLGVTCFTHAHTHINSPVCLLNLPNVPLWIVGGYKQSLALHSVGTKHTLQHSECLEILCPPKIWSHTDCHPLKSTPVPYNSHMHPYMGFTPERKLLFRFALALASESSCTCGGTVPFTWNPWNAYATVFGCTNRHTQTNLLFWVVFRNQGHSEISQACNIHIPPWPPSLLCSIWGQNMCISSHVDVVCLLSQLVSMKVPVDAFGGKSVVKLLVWFLSFLFNTSVGNSKNLVPDFANVKL